ncbi:hypothetical protein [Patulibacter minatonensis]|uniref:hypothetical protein n=1 Tax=Patulibacter minatonensis TaxID=298163 RepID=UPI00047C0738|nr:hypothetical protein [Patulibacter minatonensis]
MPSRPARRPAAVALAAGLAAAGAFAPSAHAGVVGPDVVPTVEGRGTATGGGAAQFVVRTRNVGTAATSGPVVLALSGRAVASAETPGWTCSADDASSDSRTCTLGRALGAGESAPDLTVRTTADGDTSSRAELSARVTAGGGTSYRPSLATVPVLPASPVDVGLTATAAPAHRTGERRYALVVQNGPDAATSAPLVVTVPHRTGDLPLTALSGTGWTCDRAAARCTYAATLAAGAAAPPIEARTTRAKVPEAWEEPADDGIAAVLSGGGDPATDRADVTTATGPSSYVDLTPVVDDAGAATGGARRFSVRVHGIGPADSTGVIRVAFTRGPTDALDTGLRASGAGWICDQGTSSCTYAGVVPSDGDSPPIEVVTPAGGGTAGPSLIARVTGGGDAGNEGVGPTGNNSGTASVPPVVGGLELQMRDRTPALRPRTTSATLLARNVGADDTTPVELRLFLGDARGDGWTCTGYRLCRHAPLRAGESAAPLRLTDEVPLASHTFPYDAGSFGASLYATAQSHGDVGVGTSTGVGSTAADLAVEVAPGAAPTAGGPGRFTVVARNRSPKPLTEPVTVAIDHRDAPAARITGDAWVCTERDESRTNCTHAAPLAAGSALPALAVDYVAPTAGRDDRVAVTAHAYAKDGALQDLDAATRGATASVPVVGTPVDAVVTVEDPRPQVGPAPGTASLVVRNAGSRAATGPVRLELSGGRGVSGDGWSCTRRCVHPGPLPAGGALPPVGVRVTPDTDDPTTTKLFAQVVAPGESRTGNDESILAMPAATDARGRRLAVSLPAGPIESERGDAITVSARVSASAPATEPLSLGATATPGLVVEGLAAPGLVCTDPTTCRWESGPAAGETREVVVRARIADDATGPLALGLRATSDAPDVSPGTASLRVLPRGAGADLAVTAGDAPPVALGGRYAMPLVVRNGGTADSPGPITVSYGAPATPGAAFQASGPGWDCAELRQCVWAGGLAAGGTLPEIVVRRRPFATTVNGGVEQITATVSDDADTVTTNDAAEGAARGTGASAADLAISATPAAPSVSDARGTFDVRVRNVGGRPTTDQVEVDVDTGTLYGSLDELSGSIVAATGDDWRCSGRSARCVLLRPLAAGEEAPPLRTSVLAPGFPDASQATGRDRLTSIRAQVAGGDPDGSRSDDRAVAGSGVRLAPGPDLVPSVGAADVADASGTATFEVRITNAGTAPTTNGVQVDYGDNGLGARPHDAAGDGWYCPGVLGGRGNEGHCTLDHELAPGETAPVLHVSSDHDARDDADRIRQDVRVTGDDGGWTANDAVTAYAPVRPTGAGPQLVASVDQLAPGRVGTPVAGRVRVRNVGDLPAVAAVRVDVETGTGGDVTGPGWTCTALQAGVSRCARPGPLLPGAEAPALRATAATPPKGRTTDVALRAGVVAPIGDVGAFSGGFVAASATKPGGVPAALGVLLTGGHPLRPGGSTTATAVVHNTGGAAFPGDVTVTLGATHGTVDASDPGDGWTCGTDRRCVHGGPVAPGADLPPIGLTVTAPRGPASAGTTEVTASLPPAGSPAAADDWSTHDDEAVVQVGVGDGPTDLVARIVPEAPPVRGATASVLVHVQNTGPVPAAADTVLTLTSSVPGARAEGDGWSCDGLRCTHPGPVAGGAFLKTVRLTAPVPGDAPRDAMSVTASVVNADDDATGNDASRWSTGITGAPSDGGVAASPYYAVASARARVLAGETGPFQLALSGIAPIAGEEGTVVAILPEGLTYAGGPSGAPAPQVDGRRLTWRVRFPDEGADAVVPFDVAIDRTVRPGSLPIETTMTSDALASRQRRTGAVEVTDAPAQVTGVAPRAFDDAAPTTVAFSGDLLRDRDVFELVSGSTVLRASAQTGDDHVVTGTVDPRGVAPGVYDVVVRRAVGGTLTLPGAVTISAAPKQPDPPADPGSGGGGTPAPGGGTTGPDTGGGSTTTPTTDPAAALAALLAGLGAQTPKPAPAPAAPGAAPVAARVAFSGTPRAPRTAALARSGWLVSVRTTTATAIRADLTADATTAKRLRLRRGTVLATTTTGPHLAGTVRLRLRVPTALRTKVRRANRITGTLQVRSISSTGPASTKRRVTIRR